MMAQLRKLAAACHCHACVTLRCIHTCFKASLLAPSVHSPNTSALTSGHLQSLSDEDSTAQVHPGKFTHALLEAAQRHGAELIIGQVQGICTKTAGAASLDRPGLAAWDSQTQQAAAGIAEAAPSDSAAMQASGAQEQRVTGVQVDGRMVEADAVVLALGPWTLQAVEWLPAVPEVHSQIGHSLVLQVPVPLPAEALYISWRSKAGQRYPVVSGCSALCTASSEAEGAP